MKVRLISYSQPNEDLELDEEDRLELNNIEDLIAFCAKVSNPSGQHNKSTNARLLTYLAKNAHWSPFEMVSACMEITTTRDIARQMLRHASFRFQEFSQRYANPVVDLEFVVREARLQDQTNRQNSIENIDGALEDEWRTRQQAVIDLAKETYTWAINNNIAKEQARVVLPEGNTVSRVYMNGTIRSWIHYIELRSKHGTQKEHIGVALATANAIQKIFPTIQQFI